jgi:hypothetical protein
MKGIAAATALTACLLSAGCTQPGSGPTPTPAAIPVTEVINQLKLELAAFKADTATAHVECGGVSGPLNMSVSNVQVDLSTTIVTTANGNVSATVPVSFITVGPSAGGSLAYDNSETVTLNFMPSNLVVPAGTNSGQLNLANALKALRSQIVAVSPEGQCLSFNGKKDQTIKLAFSATRDVTGGIKFTILVVSLGATLESKTTGASTLTVTLQFTGAPGVPPQIAPPGSPHHPQKTSP